MSAVLLRRIFSSSVDFYDKLDQAFQQEMKNDLLKAINEEQAQAVRKKVCDAVAELSRSLLGKLWRYLLFYRNLIIQTNFFLVERVCLRTDVDCTFVFIKNLIFFSTVALSHLKGHLYSRVKFLQSMCIVIIQVNHLFYIWRRFYFLFFQMRKDTITGKNFWSFCLSVATPSILSLKNVLSIFLCKCSIHSSPPCLVVWHGNLF